jgi:hypothetical protein
MKVRVDARGRVKGETYTFQVQAALAPQAG